MGVKFKVFCSGLAVCTVLSSGGCLRCILGLASLKGAKYLNRK